MSKYPTIKLSHSGIDIPFGVLGPLPLLSLSGTLLLQKIEGCIFCLSLVPPHFILKDPDASSPPPSQATRLMSWVSVIQLC